MMIKVPDVVIGERYSISDEMKHYIRNERRGMSPESTVSNFQLFTVERVHFDFENIRMIIAIRSVSDPNLSGGFPAEIIETCKKASELHATP